ncbi:MAG: Fe-S cluster assembly protein SufD [Pseudomonadota bacterium]
MSAPITLTAFEDRLFADLPDTELSAMLRERGLPSKRTETWKWSDLRGALRDERAPSKDYASDLPDAPIAVTGATVLVLKNGVLEPPRGVEPKPIVVSGEKIGVTYVVDDGLVVSHYNQGREADETVNPGDELEVIAALRPLMSISILPGFSHAVVLRRLSDGDGRHSDNVFVTVGEGARATLVETHEIRGKPFINSRSEIELDAKSVCERYVVQPEAPDSVLVHTSVLRLDEEKDGQAVALKQATLAFGAALARHENRVTHLGRSEAQIDGLYRLRDRQHTDMTSHITFSGEEAQTDQMVKGIAGDRARGVFQGKFFVERGAQKTDARMGHHALLLSKGAQINAKPELEIYADDVECAHGNTAGALDTEALFYMRQRGMSETEARALLIDAFAGEVLERIKNEAMRDQLAALFNENAQRAEASKEQS